jgi:hypothetical protein
VPKPLTDAEARRQRTNFIVVTLVAALVGIVFVLQAPDRETSPDSATIAASATTTTATTPTTTVRTHRIVGAASATAATTMAPALASVPTSVAPAQDPGALSQTDAKPTASGATFDTGVAALWQGIVRDSAISAAPFFFPLGAYLQVKAISNPADDYQQRLIASFAEDLHQLHTQLGADAPSATLVGLDVPDQAVWITPGVESNKLPYWRVYGSTLRYTVRGETRTFPVTSLISWRGEWYVVHLGAVR